MIQIIIKETKEFLRDKSNIFFFFIFPVMLVFLLGNLLANLDKAEEVIGEVRIHYGIEGISDIDFVTVKEFIKGLEDRKNFFFNETDDIASSIDLATDGGIDAVVLFKNDPMEIQIYEGTNRIKNRTVNSIMNGFTQLNKAVDIIIKNNKQALIDQPNYESDYIMHKDLDIKRTMLDYYAITMMTMMCFMSIMIGAICFMGERQEKTIIRLRIAPISRVKLFFGKILGLLPQTLLQILILMVFSSLLFGAHYALNLFDNIHLFFMFTVISFTMISLGAVYGLYIDVNPMAGILPVLWLMMFFSGTYSKEIVIEGLSKYLPIYQVQEAAFDLTIFGRHQKANTVIIVCLIISLAALVFGAMGFLRKEEK